MAITLELLEPFVWTDFRLAVLFTVFLPLILLIWAFVKKADAIQRLLIIYWRVASLLAITVYLMIGAAPISFLSSLMARFLIPVSLWFWEDLNEEIDDQRDSSLKLAFNSWRWAVTIYSSLGTLVQIPFVTCAFKSKADILNDGFCSVWLDPPWFYKELFHPNFGPNFLGFVGFLALVVYVIYLSYFLMVKLQRQGRSATGN
jgi:hypothetical protein